MDGRDRTDTARASKGERDEMKSRNADFLAMWRAIGDSHVEWSEEFRFDSVRRFKFDFAHEPSRVAVEIEGVTYFGPTVSRHQTTKGYVKDMEKYNLAIERGWRVLRYSQFDLKKKPVQIVEQIKSVIRRESAP